MSREKVQRPRFIPGLELNRRFFNEIIFPLLKQRYPGLEYSAGLIGYGSDVLRFDTERSTDHNWGPRVLIFLDKSDIHYKDEISIYLSNTLPVMFLGYSTHFTDKRYDGTQKMEYITSPPVRHLVELYEPYRYFQDYLKINTIENITLSDWLTFTDQQLLELTSGEIFHDGLGLLAEMREKISFYPDDIYKVRIASLWFSIWNEEAFIGRSIELKDFIGLKLISTRIINILLKIIFYLEKKYIPYSKWFMTAFTRLKAAHSVIPSIQEILIENNPGEIETKLCSLYLTIIDLHNQKKELPVLDNKIRDFFGRPYKVIFAETIVDTILKSIKDDEVKKVDLNTIAMDLKADSVVFTH